MKESGALQVLLYEGEGSRPLEGGERAGIVRALLDGGYPVSCARPGGAPPSLARGTVAVLGSFQDGKAPPVDLPLESSVHVRDVGGMDRASVVLLVDGLRAQPEGPSPRRWKPWFPVIDYSRCTNCMQCLSFCLFDVYGASAEGKIQVRNHQNCKTDCPACSRVCPEVAILFPKYRQGPINGAEIDPDDLRREAMKVDISSLLGGDIYAMLRDRSARAQSRFSKERDDERALKERQRCLSALKEQMDIPPEVLASLPSPEEIRARADAARARAEAALAEGMSQT